MRRSEAGAEGTALRAPPPRPGSLPRAGDSFPGLGLPRERWRSLPAALAPAGKSRNPRSRLAPRPAKRRPWPALRGAREAGDAGLL